jgi:hypothetical protein
MITIAEKWGAMYLCFDQKIKITPTTLTTTEGITLEVGEKITQIGRKKRTMFTLNQGIYMIYEGIYKEGNVKYAVFNCPEHNVKPNVQLELFSSGKKEVQYRYVFSCVFVGRKLNKLLIHKNNSCRDIDVSSITFLTNNQEIIHCK